MTRDRLRILQIHTRYRSGLAGEDSVVSAERELLSGRGHEVETLLFRNEEHSSVGVSGVATAARSIWNVDAAARAWEVIAAYHPDVVHAHNLWMAASPSVLKAARRSAAAVVVTAHNYRMLCASSSLVRNGVTCVQCIQGSALRAVIHGCRNGESRAQALAIVAWQGVHRLAKTYRRYVDRLIVLSPVSRERHARIMPVSKIDVIYNFASGATSSLSSDERDVDLVFAGRLEVDKGILLLLAALDELGCAARVVVLGEGPERERVREAHTRDVILWRGLVEPSEVPRQQSRARWAVVPSLVFEAPLVMLEGLSVGTPVIVPETPVFVQALHGYQCVLYYEQGDVRSLCATLQRALAMPRREWTGYSGEARRITTERFTSAIHTDALLASYRRALDDVRPGV